MLKDGFDKIKIENFPGALRELSNLKAVLKPYTKFNNEKFNKIAFDRKAEFAEWLRNNDVSSVDSYTSHISTIQNKLRVDINEFLKNGVEGPLQMITAKNFKVGPSSLSDKKVILRKYHDFLEATR